jgi:hypothetical protein
LASARHRMGTEQWVNAVFSSPPVDKLKHRSSYTQTHQPWHSDDERYAPVQGRLELHAFLALKYLSGLKLVGRYKEHPFETDEEEFGRSIKPDLLLEKLQAGTQQLVPVVLEVKTARFLTEALSLELRSNKEAFARFDLEYVVWTDRHPLGYGVRHNLLNMHRANGEDISPTEVLGLRAFVDAHPNVSAVDAIKAGFDMDCIFASAWRGAVHFPLQQCLSERSVISVSPQLDLRQTFLGDMLRSKSDWWGSLARA